MKYLPLLLWRFSRLIVLQKNKNGGIVWESNPPKTARASQLVLKTKENTSFSADPIMFYADKILLVVYMVIDVQRKKKILNDVGGRNDTLLFNWYGRAY